MFKIIINPEFENLRNYIMCMPSIFDTEGKTLYQGRNTLKCFSANNYDFVVKSFKRPIFVNKIGYTFFRPSKAKRSYEHALIVLKKGLKTPTPIAYIEEYVCGLLNRSYYISVYDSVSINVASYVHGENYDEIVLKAMAVYIARLHNNEILHLDLSPGNILINKTKLPVEFSIVDINRMKFQPITKDIAFWNFRRLSRSVKVSTFMAQQYAISQSFDVAESVEAINRYSDDFFAKKANSFLKKELKRDYGIFFSLLGPLQLYVFIKCLRTFLYKKSIDNFLFKKEQFFYYKYVKKVDFRGSIMRKNRY